YAPLKPNSAAIWATTGLRASDLGRSARWASRSNRRCHPSTSFSCIPSSRATVSASSPATTRWTTLNFSSLETLRSLTPSALLPPGLRRDAPDLRPHFGPFARRTLGFRLPPLSDGHDELERFLALHEKVLIAGHRSPLFLMLWGFFAVARPPVAGMLCPPCGHR